jgi:predicted enzyme related to lactoylglutathione lyase
MAASKSTRKKSASKKPAAKKSAAKKTAARKTTAKKPARKKIVAKRASAGPATPQKASGPAVVHWEVQAADPARQQKFFADLFDWKIDANNPMNYGMVAAGGDDGIGGGIGPTTDTSRVTVYVQVLDITAMLAKAESLGARTVLPRVDHGMIVMGQFADLEGNVIGLVEAR